MFVIFIVFPYVILSGAKNLTRKINLICYYEFLLFAQDDKSKRVFLTHFLVSKLCLDELAVKTCDVRDLL